MFLVYTLYIYIYTYIYVYTYTYIYVGWAVHRVRCAESVVTYMTCAVCCRGGGGDAGGDDAGEYFDDDDANGDGQPHKETPRTMADGEMARWGVSRRCRFL